MTRWFFLSLGVALLATAAGLYFWVKPEHLQPRVPVHWNASLEPDGWLPREQAAAMLLLYPGVLWLLVLAAWGLPKISPQNFKVESFRSVWDYVMLLVVLLFAVLMGAHVWAAITGELPARLFIGSFFLFWALIGSVLSKVQRNFWMGVRTPWTLASETVWIRTHRLAGWLWMAVGVVGLLAVLLGAPPMIAFGALIASALYPVLHSLILYKRLERQGKLEERE